MPTLIEAREAAHTGMDRAEQGAGDEWNAKADEAIRELATRKQTITADDIRAVLPPTKERRAHGPVMRRALRSGILEKTGTYTSSTFRNAAPIPVWQSTIFEGIRECLR